jgi:hypothetical protein
MFQILHGKPTLRQVNNRVSGKRLDQALADYNEES